MYISGSGINRIIMEFKLEIELKIADEIIKELIES